MQKAKIAIILTVFIDVLGIGIVIPVLPGFVEHFQAGAFQVFLLFSVFSFCAFLSAPYLGMLSDRFGRRPVLLLSILSTAIGWGVFALAGKLWVLFLGRIIDGIAAGNFPIAQSYLSDISKDDKERTQNMGLIGATFGVGFIIGPALGAFLSGYGLRIPFMVVAVLSLLNVIFGYFFLKESHHVDNRSVDMVTNPFQPIVKALYDIPLRPRYVLWFLFNIATSLQQATFAIFLADTYGFKTTSIGYVMAAVGMLIAVNQGLLLGRFWLKKFSEKTLEVWMFLLFASGFFLFGIPYIWSFALGFFPIVAGQSVIRALITSRVVSIGGKERRGQVLGTLSAIQSVAITIGPLIAGILYIYSPYGPFWLAGVVLCLSFIFAMRSFRNERLKDDKEVVIRESV